MNAALRLFVCVFSAIAFLAIGASPASANSKYAALVIHADSGDVLFDRYADQSRYPASLTKMMTLYLLFEEIEAGRLSLDSALTVSTQAAGQPPSKLGLKSGSTITVENAIEALVVKSANDVAVVVAEAVSGSEWRFAQKMTETARGIGMRKTTFRNASGLPNSKQRTTARDLATLSQRLIQDFPQFYHYFSVEKFTWNGRTYQTHNSLVKNFVGAEGLKTGYTRMSGFNLATSANRDGQRLIGIVLGGRSVRTRDSHMREILTTAFSRIESNPALIASLHRTTPEPRLKPTLLAALQASAPTIAASSEVQSEIFAAATSLANVQGDQADPIGSLIAAASVPNDLNEYERARLASLSPAEGVWGEGDTEDQFGGAAIWSVQIGAFSTKSLAQEKLEEAARFAGLAERARNVQAMAMSTGETLYRARFTSLTASDAGDICNGLRDRGLACFVVSEPTLQ